MAPIDRYRRPQDLPDRIPVFPLRGAVLLPRAAMPLNIFEPRYLAMVDEAMSGARLIGIVQPVDTGEDRESPLGKIADVRRVGCVGRITAYQELDDGRLLITLTGITRFGLVAEMPTDKPYRVWRIDAASYACDLDRGRGEDLVDREKLLSVLRLYLDRRNLKADWRAIAGASTEFLVNALSVASPFGPEEKQALLEAPDLVRRAEVLIALAEMEIASSEGGAGTTMQ